MRFPRTISNMNSLSMLLWLSLALAPTAAADAADEAATLAIVTAGHWQSGQQQGVYRVRLENVGFEHVSCRVWIEWLAAAAPGKPLASVAKVPLAEASDSFWSCPARSGTVVLDDGTLQLKLVHAYSLEPRVFNVTLGAPGSYQLHTDAQP